MRIQRTPAMAFQARVACYAELHVAERGPSDLLGAPLYREDPRLGATRLGGRLGENPEAGCPTGLERTIGDLVTGTLTGTLQLSSGDPDLIYWEDSLNPFSSFKY